MAQHDVLGVGRGCDLTDSDAASAVRREIAP
jgi:hypothetical protein